MTAIRPALFTAFLSAIVLWTEATTGIQDKVVGGMPVGSYKRYIAPSPLEPMPARSQQYLLGILSFLFVSVAAVLGVRAMMNINYDDDSLLMVEIPEATMVS
ncbi:hypothetical protein ERJ75_000956400 [Trypanosoma vivax]|uniref:Uncharacterized protein n=1 Tax=Trypanosoma vivax (strain Y486) TaxID=1055687 RepID=G0U4R3_TRYVY|nr:hypothetical protein TRVL_01687 [Trypanosoma vivax]KAH8611301.1 hypothetical protein ERJ75_000956400 [Trypanosoma vivax]CCC52427.1 conserved hypothetical protein [Trypanosoma vivax Y486]